MLTFAYPWLFLALLLPLLTRYLLPVHREKRTAVRAPFTDRLARLTGREPASGAVIVRRRRSQWILLLLAWVLVVAALARPQWLEDPLVKDLPMRDLLVAVDLSGSMETLDFENQQGQTVDRLTAVKEVLDGFLSAREGDRVGLIFFGSAAFVQAPFTGDLDVVRELLGEAQVRMLGPRTMMGDAIGLAISLFERSEVEERVLIVLTDGNDTGSMVAPDRAAEIARDQGVVIHTIAIGDPEAAGEQALDEVTLQTVSATTGGEYFFAGDREAMESVYDQLDQLNPRQVETISYRPRTELFFWPLAATILLTILFLGFNELPYLKSAWGRRLQKGVGNS